MPEEPRNGHAFRLTGNYTERPDAAQARAAAGPLAASGDGGMAGDRGRVARAVEGGLGRRRGIAERDVAPGIAVAEQRPQQLVIEPMPGAQADELAEQGRAGEIEVADGVDHLVAHELVAIAQAVLVHDVGAID